MVAKSSKVLVSLFGMVKCAYLEQLLMYVILCITAPCSCISNETVRCFMTYGHNLEMNTQ